MLHGPQLHGPNFVGGLVLKVRSCRSGSKRSLGFVQSLLRQLRRHLMRLPLAMEGQLVVTSVSSN